jgi:hypothetical protein
MGSSEGSTWSGGVSVGLTATSGGFAGNGFECAGG